MTIRVAAALFLCAATGCVQGTGAPPETLPVTQPPTPPVASPSTYVGLGQTVHVDGPRVTPLEVLEDSRCPMNARCVWAGQVRLRIAIELGAGSTEREITSGTPIDVADGRLELVEVQPDRVAGEPLDPSHYRFGFRFAGGL